MDLYKLKRVKELVEKNAKGREIVFWGKHEAIYQAFSEDGGVDISKVFSSNRDLLADKTLNIYPHTELRGCAAKYYVVMPFIFNKNTQQKIMKDFGYTENKDYCYFDVDRKILKKNDSPLYEDSNGNSVSGNFNDIQILLEGCCNKIEVDESCKNLSIDVKGSGHNIKIGKIDFRSVKGGKNNIMISGTDNEIVINDGCRFTNCNIMLFSDSILTIGEKSSFERDLSIYMHPFSNCHIGKDCMFSFDICLQCGDGHSIFDIKTKSNINSNLEWLDKQSGLSEMYIGDHVWVGRNAMIMGGSRGKITEISNGSIVGAKSLVKGNFPNNVILAGSPARIIRKDVAWSRNNRSSDINDCMGYTMLTDTMSS